MERYGDRRAAPAPIATSDRDLRQYRRRDDDRTRSRSRGRNSTSRREPSPRRDRDAYRPSYEPPRRSRNGSPRRDLSPPRERDAYRPSYDSPRPSRNSSPRRDLLSPVSVLSPASSRRSSVSASSWLSEAPALKYGHPGTKQYYQALASDERRNMLKSQMEHGFAKAGGALTKRARVHPGGSYPPGTVFVTVVHSTDGRTPVAPPVSSPGTPDFARTSSADIHVDDPNRTPTPFGTVYSKQRKMVVVDRFADHVLCVPIYTHEGRGISHLQPRGSSPHGYWKAMANAEELRRRPPRSTGDYYDEPLLTPDKVYVSHMYANEEHVPLLDVEFADTVKRNGSTKDVNWLPPTGAELSGGKMSHLWAHRDSSQPGMSLSCSNPSSGSGRSGSSSGGDRTGPTLRQWLHETSYLKVSELMVHRFEAPAAIEGHLTPPSVDVLCDLVDKVRDNRRQRERDMAKQNEVLARDKNNAIRRDRVANDTNPEVLFEDEDGIRKVMTLSGLPGGGVGPRAGKHDVAKYFANIEWQCQGAVLEFVKPKPNRDIAMQDGVPEREEGEVSE